MPLRALMMVSAAAIASPAALGCARPPARQPRAPVPASASLRVMTYNVNFGIPGDAPTMDAINAARADVV